MKKAIQEILDRYGQRVTVHLADGDVAYPL